MIRRHNVSTLSKLEILNVHKEYAKMFLANKLYEHACNFNSLFFFFFETSYEMTFSTEMGLELNPHATSFHFCERRVIT